MVYILLLLYTVYLIYEYDVKGRLKGRNRNFYTLLIFIVGIVGFSYRLGMDTVGYMLYYDSMEPDLRYALSHLSEFRYEPIFTILLVLCKCVNADFFVLQILVAVFVNGVFFWFFRRHSPSLFFSIFLYIIIQGWNFNFEIKRESIAIAFWLIAVDRYMRGETEIKKYFGYFLWCIPAILSHRFAFTVLFYPLFMKLRLNTISITIMCVLSIGLLFHLPFVRRILSAFNFIFAYWGQEESMMYYLNSSRFGAGAITIWGYITSFVIPFVMLLSLRKKELDKCIMALSVLYLFVVLVKAEVFICYRITNYLFFFSSISFSYIFQYCLKRTIDQRQMLLLGVFVVFMLYPKFLKEKYIRYSPYTSIFNKEINREREIEYIRLDEMLNY